MNIELTVVKSASRKLTYTLISQFEEARMKDMIAALENPEENILGYIKPAPNKSKIRLFILKVAPLTYRVVSNYNWEKASNADHIAYGKIGDKVCMKKEFKDMETRDSYVRMFKEIKSIALQQQLYL